MVRVRSTARVEVKPMARLMVSFMVTVTVMVTGSSRVRLRSLSRV